MRSFFLLLAMVGVFLTLPACTVSTQHVGTILELDKAKAQTYADVSESFRNFAVALKEAAPPGGATAVKCDAVIAYLDRKDADFDKVARDSVRAVNAMKWLSDEDRDKYMEELFGVIAVLKGEGSGG